MREVFGDVRLVRLGEGYGVEAVGLHRPTPLTSLADGSPLPDFSALVGRVLNLTGVIVATPGNIETLDLLVADLHDSAPGLTQPSPLYSVVTGNLGKTPETNPRDDRLTASLALQHTGDEACWLRLTSYRYRAVSDLFTNLTAGALICAYGSMESYDYKDRERLQLNLNGFGAMRIPGASAERPTSYARARNADDAACVTANAPGVGGAVDAFTAA